MVNLGHYYTAELRLFCFEKSKPFIAFSNPSDKDSQIKNRTKFL
jgi:hypothetical protein